MISFVGMLEAAQGSGIDKSYLKTCWTWWKWVFEQGWNKSTVTVENLLPLNMIKVKAVQQAFNTFYFGFLADIGVLFNNLLN